MNTLTHGVCIHGHFYQPPRENPWTEHIVEQPSAAPFHDWNARVTHECYAPNTHARILDGEGKILKITNNYKHISFNVGPTLLGWLETHRPDVHAAILEADREGAAQFGGHGPAIAQVYNHLIMPLATARDRRTQVIWGIEDFTHRFGRKPEGMWLAETAVDLDTLEALAEHGIRFTILAPHQAARWRAGEDAPWQDLAHQEDLDTSRAYVQKLESGRQIALFFYDGPTSRAVAFERLLDDGERFANRLVTPLCPESNTPQLSHIATDGESYGHHHTYGEMALAYTLAALEDRPDVSLTVYGQWLEAHPPTTQVEIVEDSSWSCAHGVERWRSDCGCQTGAPPGTNQSWRAPLRQALDMLRDQASAWLEEHAAAHFEDLWGARDRYIEVMLSPTRRDAFLRREATREDPDTEALEFMAQCMELMRQLMLMYTSCGWFFHDLAGIETIQILRYAGRALELHQALGGEDVTPRFLELLAMANAHDGRNGRQLFEQEVLPLMHAGLTRELVTMEEAVAARLERALDTWLEHPLVASHAREVLDVLRLGTSLELVMAPHQDRLMRGLARARQRVESGSHASKESYNNILNILNISEAHKV